jgi:lysyl-tRNA synthetase class 1
MNLAGATGAESTDTLWSFVDKYLNNGKRNNNLVMTGAMENAINYFNDFLKPTRVFKIPKGGEKIAIKSLIDTLLQVEPNTEANDIQQLILDIGKINNFENNREWFKLIYEVMLGTENGPRLGSFITLLGIGKTIETLRRRVNEK